MSATLDAAFSGLIPCCKKTLVVAGGTGDSFPKLGRVYRGGHAVDLVVANIEHEFDELEVVPLGHLAPTIQIAFPRVVGH